MQEAVKDVRYPKKMKNPFLSKEQATAYATRLELIPFQPLRKEPGSILPGGLAFSAAASSQSVQPIHDWLTPFRMSEERCNDDANRICY